MFKRSRSLGTKLFELVFFTSANVVVMTCTYHFLPEYVHLQGSSVVWYTDFWMYTSSSIVLRLPDLVNIKKIKETWDEASIFTVCNSIVLQKM